MSHNISKTYRVAGYLLLMVFFISPFLVKGQGLDEIQINSKLSEFAASKQAAISVWQKTDGKLEGLVIENRMNAEGVKFYSVDKIESESVLPITEFDHLDESLITKNNADENAWQNSLYGKYLNSNAIDQSHLQQTYKILDLAKELNSELNFSVDQSIWLEDSQLHFWELNKENYPDFLTVNDDPDFKKEWLTYLYGQYSGCCASCACGTGDPPDPIIITNEMCRVHPKFCVQNKN